MTEEQAAHLIKKVESIEYAINGDGKDRMGMAHEVRNHHHTLYGTDDKMGLVTKMNIIWRIHVWLLCTLSMAIGWVFKALVEHFHL